MKHELTKRHTRGETQAAKKLGEIPEARPKEYQDNKEEEGARDQSKNAYKRRS